jgi:hypothetical protein
MSSLGTLYWCANEGCVVEEVPYPPQGQKLDFCFREIFGKTNKKVGYFYPNGCVFLLNRFGTLSQKLGNFIPMSG